MSIISRSRNPRKSINLLRQRFTKDHCIIRSPSGESPPNPTTQAISSPKLVPKSLFRPSAASSPATSLHHIKSRTLISIYGRDTGDQTSDSIAPYGPTLIRPTVGRAAPGENPACSNPLQF
jgi:hypothetical protein